MTHDDKPTNSADSASRGANHQTSDRSPDTHPEHLEQIHAEDNVDPNSIPEIQIRPESNVDPSSSNTSSLDLVCSISSDQDAQSSPLNNGYLEDSSISNGLIAELSEAYSSPRIQSEPRLSSKSLSNHPAQGETPPICYNTVLDNEIRARLDKLNGLSDLINSLELQFDQANALFNETLKCSTEKLSTIARNLGSKSIRKGRLYHAAKISVEQTQSACQRACVQFEQANVDHQHAKMAIKEAESKLHEINSACREIFPDPKGCTSDITLSEIDIGRLKLHGESDLRASGNLEDECDNVRNRISSSLSRTVSGSYGKTTDLDAAKLINSANLSEDLNHAINRLVEAEEKRLQSEKLHLDQANKLMIAQENLTKLEREHGASIRRAQIYFEEARCFNAKLNSVKSDITRVSGDIAVAKKAYAKTLTELEQFSEDLRIHFNASNVKDSRPQSEQQ